jgi:prepilin-type N-terminal cleavage/methylation domain-containing protein
MKKKGFTLIELLAVIVILSIVALITFPLVLGIISSVEKSAYKESLRSLFTATDIYIAGKNFIDFPEEGINVMDAEIEIKNKNFTSGKIFEDLEGQLVLDKVSNGKYCAGGTIDNLLIVEGSCDQLDTTPPTISITSNLVTSSSITIVATAEDLESGINGYQFSKDNGITWTSKQISNVYNFTGLTNNTDYTFKVRVYNNNDLKTVSEQLVVTTSDIPIPTYSIDPSGWTQSAVVTINYPQRQTGYIYEYSLDGAISWQELEEPSITTEVTFNENGNIIARILDGTNEVSGTSYEVTNIDTISPVITVTPTIVNITAGSVYNDIGVIAIDDMLGDITDDIVITSNLDINNPGEYTITYNVSDQAGNVAEAKTRTVIVTLNLLASNSIFPNVYTNNNYYKSVDIEVKGVTATNLFGTYGDFEIDSDLDGIADNFYIYNGKHGELNSLYKVSGNYSQKVTFNTTLNGHGLRFAYNIPNSTDKYYISYYTLFPNTNIHSTSNSFYSGSINTIDSNMNNTTNIWQKQSVTFTVNNPTSVSFYPRRQYSTTNVEDDVMYFDGMTFINTTEIFGVDNDINLFDYNTIFPKYFDNTANTNVTFVSEGKNLSVINNKTVTNSPSTVTLVELEPNTTYTLSAFIDATASSAGQNRIRINIDNGTQYYFGNHIEAGSSGISKLTFTTPADFNQIAIQAQPLSVPDSAIKYFSQIQLEKGAEATTYEPYISTTNTVNLNHNQTTTINLPLYLDGRIRKVVNSINSWTTTYNYKK